MTGSLINYFTTFESTNNLPMVIAIGHGENADLVASFTDCGVEVNLSGYTARAIYQPKSKWGTDDWYECSCEIEANKVVAHWGNTYDNGDNAVKLFMHLSKDNKVAYPAIYQIRLFETPGFTPSAIEPIPETIDFSQYTLLNAPWALQSDFNVLSGSVNTLSGTVETLTNNLPYSIREVTIGQDGIVYPVSREVVGVKFSDAQATAFSIQLPNPTDGKAVDFYVDICNNHDYSLPATLINTGWGEEPYRYYWKFALDASETLSSILTIKGQDISSGYARLHFSQIGLDITNNDPILNITKQEFNNPNW